MSTETITQAIPAGTYEVDPVHSTARLCGQARGRLPPFAATSSPLRGTSERWREPGPGGHGRRQQHPGPRRAAEGTPPLSRVLRRRGSTPELRFESSELRVADDGAVEGCTATLSIAGQSREVDGKRANPRARSTATSTAVSHLGLLLETHGRPPRVRPRLAGGAAERRRGHSTGQVQISVELPVRPGGRVAMRVLGHLRQPAAGVAEQRPAAGRRRATAAGAELVPLRAAPRDPALRRGRRKEGPAPDAVRELREAIRDADAVLVATPEYNHSIPGQLKNALDWASRPAGQSALTASRRRRSAPRPGCSARSGRRPRRARCWRPGRARGRGGAAGRPRQRAPRRRPARAPAGAGRPAGGDPRRAGRRGRARGRARRRLSLGLPRPRVGQGEEGDRGELAGRGGDDEGMEDLVVAEDRGGWGWASGSRRRRRRPCRGARRRRPTALRSPPSSPPRARGRRQPRASQATCRSAPRPISDGRSRPSRPRRRRSRRPRRRRRSRRQGLR